MLSEYDKKLLRRAGWGESFVTALLTDSRIECFCKDGYSIANDSEEAFDLLEVKTSGVRNRSTAKPNCTYILYGPNDRIYILPSLLACADALVTKFHEHESMLDLSGRSYKSIEPCTMRSNYMGGEIYYQNNKFHYEGKYGHIISETESELYDKIDIAKEKQEEAELKMLKNLKNASRSKKHAKDQIAYHVWGTFYVNGSLKDPETLRKSDNYKFYGATKDGAINKAKMLVRSGRGLAHYIKIVPGPDVHVVPLDDEPIESSTHVHRKITVYPKCR